MLKQEWKNAHEPVIQAVGTFRHQFEGSIDARALPRGEVESQEMILSDNETKADLLNNRAIATTIVSILKERPDRPVTIGVHGDWGAGKSSVLEMIEAEFAQEDKSLCLKFNGWRFQGFEDAKIALIEGIVTGLLEKRPDLLKFTDTVGALFKRIDLLKVAKHASGLAVTALTGLPTPDQIGSILGMFEKLIEHPADLVTKETLEATAKSVKDVIKPAETKKLPQEVEEFRKAFDKLLSDAKIDQLIVLVDDLDRCLPDTAIETLEAIRLFVFTAKTAFVVAADEAMIEYAVRKHFPDLPDSTGPRDYARNYLEKLIQIPFRIPALGESETRIYVTLLLAGAQLPEDDPGYATLIEVATRKLTRPWETTGLDPQVIKQSLGASADKAAPLLFLSDQIGPVLAAGTKGNPRQIKRFLNALLLRQKMAQARGFGQEVQLPILAKLMLAERFYATLFEKIWSSSMGAADGKSPDLAALESTSPQPSPAAAGTPAAGQTKDPSASPELSLPPEWKAWAAINPPLAGIDLRPYLFVTKDRKAFFGATSSLGHLEPLADSLMGNKILVQGLEPQLKTLAPTEIDALFEAVRTRIMRVGDFQARPGGIDGIILLSRVQPSLQDRAIDLLESIPPDRLGPWAVGGWQGVITSPGPKGRLDALILKWSTLPGTSMLKAAAAAVLKPLKGTK